MCQFFRLHCGSPAVPRRLSLRPSALSQGDSPCSYMGQHPRCPQRTCPTPRRAGGRGRAPRAWPLCPSQARPSPTALRGLATPPPAAPAACGLRSHVPPQQPNNPSACNTAQFCFCSHNPFPFFSSVSFRHPGKGREKAGVNPFLSSGQTVPLSRASEVPGESLRLGRNRPAPCPALQGALTGSFNTTELLPALTFTPQGWMCLILSSLSCEPQRLPGQKEKKKINLLLKAMRKKTWLGCRSPVQEIKI